MRHHPRRAHVGTPPHRGGFPPGHTAAFADGRRLREVSRARRRPRVARHVLPVALVALLVVAASNNVLGSVLLGMGVAGIVLGVLAWVLSPLLLVGVVAFVIVRHTRRRQSLRRGGAAGTAPLPARPAAPPRPDLVWAHAQRRFHALRGEYAAYECDAMAVLRLPALADVAVPSTARFVDAFSEAQALETDAFPGERFAAGFVAAVDRAGRAWKAARDAAERIRLSGLSPAERSSVERVLKLLTTARDSDNEAERLAAYTLARSELAKLDRAGVLHVPLPARAVLDEGARGALPA